MIRKYTTYDYKMKLIKNDYALNKSDFNIIYLNNYRYIYKCSKYKKHLLSGLIK